MKEIQLTQGKVALVDDEDFEFISQWKWCFNGRYAVRSSSRTTGRKNVQMHRVLAKVQPGFQTDHINHDKLDNRKSNLRACSEIDNHYNVGKRANNTSGYKGVVAHYGKWGAQIKKDKKHFWLGVFATKIEAALAYNEAAKRYHGDFAVIN